jgi:hypothetical protein
MYESIAAGWCGSAEAVVHHPVHDVAASECLILTKNMAVLQWRLSTVTVDGCNLAAAPSRGCTVDIHCCCACCSWATGLNSRAAVAAYAAALQAV